MSLRLQLNKRVICIILCTIVLVGFGVSKAMSKADGTLVLSYEFANTNVGNAGGTIKLTSNGSSSSGSYDIYWADASGKLAEYDKIASLSVGGSCKLVSLNAIPSGATKVVAMKDSNVVASYDIPATKQINVNENFTFGALSDIHLDGDGSDETNSQNDFQAEIDYFKSKNVAAICNSGDITLDGRSGDLDAVVKKISSAGVPVYTARGNHDCRNACASESDWAKIESNGLIFEKIINNEVFVFLGMAKEDYTNTFTSEQLSKLESILEQNKDKRVFLFEHVFFGEVGNVKNLYPYSDLSDSGTAGQFKEIMKKYQNVITFTGHSHLDFELQRISEYANVAEKDGSYGYRVHCPSASKPRKNDADTEDVSANTYTYEEGALGYLVEVYDNYIVLIGRDFTKNINLPYATYILNTAPGSSRISGSVEESNVISESEVGNVDLDKEGSNVISDSEVDNVNLDNEEINIVSDGNSSFNTNSGKTDIIIVLDKSISYNDRFSKAKEAAKNFASSAIAKNTTRVGVVEFGLTAKLTVDLTSSASEVSTAISNINVQSESGSNMHAGVSKAIDELKTSDANEKVIVIISDGRTNRTIDDLANHNREKSREAVKTLLNDAKTSMSNLKIATIDCSTSDDTDATAFLKSIATSNDNGKLLYYEN